MLKRIVAGVATVLIVAVATVYGFGSGILGSPRGTNPVTDSPIPDAVLAQRAATQLRDSPRDSGDKQILFGDLHVHSTVSTDAFQLSMQLFGGDGARPVSDACDFARYCSALDFWSINDHALSITPQSWDQTKASIRQCNAVSGDQANPDSVAYLGWEWTQIGDTAKNHYGHKNVILKGLDEADIPPRPISAGFPPGADPSGIPTLALGLLPFLIGMNEDTQDYIDYMQHLAATPDCPAGIDTQKLPKDCREVARTPEALFAKLNSWGSDAMVIPHGTTWGYYTPAGSSWAKQLTTQQHDSKLQNLVEVFSGHGNSEQYRPWREVEFGAGGSASCPEPVADFTPSCWRAGAIIYERCSDSGASASECEARAETARQNYLDADLSGFLTMPGTTGSDWLDAGQCNDCFLPSFNYRPLSSVQYMLALGNFEDPSADKPQRFRFGFMASSDNHSARPGTGYKEYARTEMTEARFGVFDQNPIDKRIEEPVAANSRAFDAAAYPNRFTSIRETERQGSFFLTGGLIAVQADSRSREDIWDAMQRRQVYGTSGPRILLWFDLLNGADDTVLPMGAETAIGDNPRFRVRAAGSLEQKPGCPDYANQALSAERMHYLCRGECYNPSDTRRTITRIEVVRIRPQASPGEDVDGLIEDPWLVLPCAGDTEGCSVEFSDPEFTAAARDTLYYVRAIEEPRERVNADPLRCTRDAEGNCTEVELCTSTDPSEDCLAKAQERAWSSPIFIDFDPAAVISIASDAIDVDGDEALVAPEVL
jgi:hypothetical protein